MSNHSKKKCWIKRHIQDSFVKQSQKDGYRSRAAYKLEEIVLDYNLFHGITNVLDLGCSPGSWSQFVLNTNKNVNVVGVDLLDTTPLSNSSFYFIKGDFTESAVQNAILAKFNSINSKGIELLLSDMAPDLTGNSVVDQARLEELSTQVISYCSKYLKKDGSCLMKLFHGMHFDTVLKLASLVFKNKKVIKPKASRSKSSECYLLMQKLNDRYT